jgi:hypothetical protein
LHTTSPFISSKAGPNGPKVLLSAHKDATAVSESDFYESLILLGKKAPRIEFDFERVLRSMVSLDALLDPSPTKRLTSRLHFISEGGGKTRVVAIVD